MSDKIYQTLKILSDKLCNTDYVLIGSANLCVQGLNLEPFDIDILTTQEDIIKIDRILQEYRTKEIYFDNRNSWNCFISYYQIGDIQIEVLANLDNDRQSIETTQKKIVIKFNDLVLPCISLVGELETYKKMNRLDKIKLIEDFLKNN